MSVRLFAMTCGWLTGPRGSFLAGETGRLRVPVPSYLIVHPKGLALFDSGMHVATQTNPAERLGAATARFFDVHFQAGEELAARLAAMDVDVGAVRFLVSSHLHFDHTGGNAQVPNATLIVQRAEWDAGHDAALSAANHYNPMDYDLGHDVRVVEGEHDLFGDGTVVCLPTYGHTPGHQALRVRLGGGEVVLTGDACYLRQTLEDLHLPTIVHDRADMLASLMRLRALRDRGARIFYGHDPEFWATVPQAPAEIR